MTKYIVVKAVAAVRRKLYIWRVPNKPKRYGQTARPKYQTLISFDHPPQAGKVIAISYEVKEI